MQEPDGMGRLRCTSRRPRATLEAHIEKPAAVEQDSAASETLDGLSVAPQPWTVDVDRNWRITFSFDGRDRSDVNYEDYH